MWRQAALLPEEAEIDASVGTVSDETGMVAEIVILAVLDDKETFRGKHLSCQYHVWQLGDFLQDVWGVGKDYVKPVPASADVFEYVSPDYCCIGLLQLVEEALDETAVQWILLDADYACASS